MLLLGADRLRHLGSPGSTSILIDLPSLPAGGQSNELGLARRPFPHSGPSSGIAVRAGSVREARIRAGLTLAQLGGSELTRSAIHRIENGLSRPSLRSLGLIAKRTQVSLVFFLPDRDGHEQATVGYLELLASKGEYEELDARGEHLLDQDSLPLNDRAAVHRWMGEANVRLMRPERALEHLEIAIAELTDQADPWMMAIALHLKSSALYLLDDPECRFVAEAALRLCRELNPIPPMLEARILNHLAAIAVHHAEWKQAIQLYDRALVAAETLRDLRQLSLMYEGLGMAHDHLGRAGVAGQYFAKAVGLYELQEDMSSIARAEVNLSELLIRTGDLASADSHLQKSLRHCDDDGVDRKNRTNAMVVLARLRLKQGREDEAESLADEVLRLAGERGESLSEAGALEVLGLLMLRTGRYKQADVCFMRALSVFNSLDLVDRLRACHIDYAEALDRQGRISEGRDQWRQAALLGRDEIQATSRIKASAEG